MSLAYLQQLREPRFVSVPDRVIRKEISRSWHDRFFTWPWRPWIHTTTITVPDPQICFDQCSLTFYGHPATLLEYRRRCEANERTKNS